MSTSADPTHLLVTGRRGKKEAIDQLMPQVHSELKEIAHRLLRKRPANGVLDTTGLVHEVYLELIDQSRVEWTDRAHFQALSARAMRQILVDHFRRQEAQKRGGDRQRVTFQQGEIPVGDRGEVLLTVNDALDRLQEQDARKARVVLYRFFGGMTTQAIADVLDLSTRTVERDWRAARAWLKRELAES